MNIKVNITGTRKEIEKHFKVSIYDKKFTKTAEKKINKQMKGSFVLEKLETSISVCRLRERDIIVHLTFLR